MKRSLMLCLTGLALVVSAAWAQSGKAGSTEQAVTALEQKWLQSQVTNNPDMIAPLLADKLVDTSGDGKFTGKAGALAMAKTMKYTSAEYEDVKVTVFGDTAIATGGFKGKGTDTTGKAFDVHERWTDTWVKMPSGDWQCVATQTTPIK